MQGLLWLLAIHLMTSAIFPYHVSSLFPETHHFKIDKLEACMDCRCQTFIYEVSQ
jgi:hypothetical protein